MNAINTTAQTITIAYGPSFRDTFVWQDIHSELIKTLETSSLAAAKSLKPELILLDHQLINAANYEVWQASFPVH